MAGQLGGVRLASVMDREADFFELFHERRSLGTLDLLVRAKHNRRLAKGSPSCSTGGVPAQAQMRIEVLRSSGRRGTRRQKERAAREARTAEVALRRGRGR